MAQLVFKESFVGRFARVWFKDIGLREGLLVDTIHSPNGDTGYSMFCFGDDHLVDVDVEQLRGIGGFLEAYEGTYNEDLLEAEEKEVA